MTEVFVYGPLQYHAIREALFGTDYTTTDATLTGYKAYLVEEMIYPGIKKQEGSTVSGLLLTGLSISDLRILDKFQDSFTRTLKTIHVGEKQKIVSVYEQKNDVLLSDTKWDVDTFKHVEIYTDTIIPAFFEELKTSF